MKEGTLSSALVKRYGIKEKDAKGTVLWHSLNENGKISVYDMKFGNTIIRNLGRRDLIEHKDTDTGHKRDDKHGTQHVDDLKRGKKKK